MTEQYQKDAAAEIFRKNGFSDAKLTLSGIGFRNQVWLGEDAVLKVYGADNRTGQALETWFYRNVHPDFAPKLYAAGENWILLERIHGTGLYRLWRDMDDGARKKAVERIAEIACAINRVPLAGTDAFLPVPSDFGDALLSEIHRLAALLTEKNAIDPRLCRRAIAYAEQHRDVFGEEDCVPVYNDLHFDNLMVTEDKRIVLLDYEMMTVAPCDRVLDVWQRMTIHPFVYANEDDHPLTKPEDYRNLLYWMRDAAPHLFAHPSVRARVNLYGIRYELDLLCDYPRAAWPEERLRIYLEKGL